MNKIIPIAILCCAAPFFIIGIIAWTSSDDQMEGENVGTNIGDKAPSFSIIDSAGKKMRLSDYRGKKIVVITSSATWCATCIIEAREFTPVYKEFKDKGVEFLSVSIDPTDNDRKMEEFKKNYNAPWPHTHPGIKGVKAMIIDYKLTRFEITYIIDKEGVIRFRDGGITSSAKLKEEIEKVFTGIELEDLGIEYGIQGQEHIGIGEDHPPYNSNPPTSGWHYGAPADWGMYAEELPDEQLIHNLEHGGIWASYKPEIGEEQIRRLDYIIGVNDFYTKVIISPRSKNDSDIVVAAWRRLLELTAPVTQEKEDQIIEFVERYRNKGPEFIPDTGI